MKETTHSPRPYNAITGSKNEMSFPDALREVIIGKKITKSEWDNPGIYGFLNGDILSLHKDNGKNYKWIISIGDLTGDDWIVLDQREIIKQ